MFWLQYIIFVINFWHTFIGNILVIHFSKINVTTDESTHGLIEVVSIELSADLISSFCDTGVWLLLKN